MTNQLHISPVLEESMVKRALHFCIRLRPDKILELHFWFQTEKKLNLILEVQFRNMALHQSKEFWPNTFNNLPNLLNMH